MANSIALFKKYIDNLDEVYKLATLTSDLDSNGADIQQGANANEIVIPKISMDGLGDYDRNNGYAKGSVSLTHETVAFDYDRGRKFDVDSMDNEETAGVAFGRLASEFIRTKVVPEMDAYTFATLSGVSGILSPAGATLSSGADVIAALRVAANAMDEAEVPAEGRILYITPTLRGMVEDLATTASREVLNKFSKIVSVPQTRFYTAIDLLDGTTSGEEVGGFAKATAGKNINFMCVTRDAVLKYTKHTVNKVLTPEQNPDSDAWRFFYRAYGLVDAYENKVAGIYLHKQA